MNQEEKSLQEKALELRREYHRNWRKKHEAHVKEYNRRWRAENQAKIKANRERYWLEKAAQELAREEGEQKNE